MDGVLVLTNVSEEEWLGLRFRPTLSLFFCIEREREGVPCSSR